MSKKQARNYREHEILRITARELLALGWDEKTELAVYRCPNARDEDECSCPSDDCSCCDNHALWESATNVPGWEVLCGHCETSAYLVEVIGTSRDVGWKSVD